MATKPKQVVLQSGKLRWRITVHLGCHVTRSKSPLKTKTFSTEKKALAWARKMETLRDDDGVIATDRRTVREYLEQWMQDKEAGLVGNKKPRSRTVSDYERLLQAWIFEPPKELSYPLHGCRMKALKVTVVDEFYRSMREDCGAKPYLVHRLHRLLDQAFKTAVQKRLLTHNPTKNASVIKPKQNSKRKAMTAEQAAAFLTAARKLTDAGDDPYSALWHVILDGGLRPGEAFGLKWPEVDWEAGAVHVKQTLVRLLGKGWRLEQPKTKHSVRTVPLNTVTMQELRKWKLASEFTADDDFVFTTYTGTPLNSPRRSFTRVCEEAGIGEYREAKEKKGPSGPQPQPRFKPAFTIYELRHTCASLMHHEGVPLVVIGERLGHSPNSLVLLQTYLHSDPESQRGATDMLGNVLYGTGANGI
jgi:integrase